MDSRITTPNLRNDRIRFYQQRQQDRNCPIITYIIANWLWIDDAREEDANLDISCQASYSLGGSIIVEKSVNLSLHPG